MHVVVVGGGIAGLAAAWFLRAPGVRVTVLEGAARVGGKLALGEVAGLTLDLGAEALLARRPEALELVRAVGLGEGLVHPRTTSAGVWTHGAIHPLPAAQVMGVPSEPGGGALIGILSRAGAARVAGDLLLPLRQQSDVSVGEFVRERMGNEVVARLVDPLLGGVYAGRADDLSMFATLPQLARAVYEPERLMTVAAQVREHADTTAPVFAGIRGGVGRLPGRLVEVCGAQVRTGVFVRELHRAQPQRSGRLRRGEREPVSEPASGSRLPSRLSPASEASTSSVVVPDSPGLSDLSRSQRTTGRWRLVAGPTTAPESIDADAVVLAVPAPAAARLLRGVDFGAAADLAGIEYASMAIVTLVLPAGPELQGSGFLVPAVDGRVIKAVTHSSTKWEWTHLAAGGSLVLRASVGRIGDVADLACSDEDLIAKVRTDLFASIGLGATPIDAAVTRWGGALPQYAVGHLDRVDRIRGAVEAVPGLAVCGAAYEGVGIAACIASARRAADVVLAHWRNDGRMSP